MRILFNIAHPAQVHLFKNLIWSLEKRGHKCKITAVNKDVSLNLLKSYGFDYELVGNAKSSLLFKAIELIKIEYKLCKIVKTFRPDILVGGSGNVYVAHVGKVTRKPSIVFDDDDTERARVGHLFLNIFTSTICSPSCFKKDLGKKQIRFDGYKELAYLHPNNFRPSPAIFDKIGLSEEDTFIILRFVSWTADHDINEKGFDLKIKKKLVEELGKYATIFISSEASIPKEFEKFKFPLPPDKIHDFLYYAKMLVCDSQTMATEAGVLGTPAIRCNSFVGNNDMGNFIELEQRYGLIFNYNNPDKAIAKAIELIQRPNLKEEWKEKREVLLTDKIDVTAFMVWLIENYPECCKNLKTNLDSNKWVY